MSVNLKPAAKRAAGAKRAADEPAESDAKKPAAAAGPVLPDVVSMHDMLQRRLVSRRSSRASHARTFVDTHLAAIVERIANADNWNLGSDSVAQATVTVCPCPSDMAADIADELARRLDGYKFQSHPVSALGETMLRAQLATVPVPPKAVPVAVVGPPVRARDPMWTVYDPAEVW